MEFYQELQFLILESLGLFCLFLAGFLFLAKSINKTRRDALIRLELWTALLIFSDCFAYSYRGESGKFAYWMVRISNFMVFLSTLVIIAIFCVYVKTWIDKSNKRIPKWLGFIVIWLHLGIIMLVVSQFANIYYSFDNHNRYQREKGFVIAYIFPVVCLTILCIITIRSFNDINKHVAISLLFFTMSPYIAAAIQTFLYGTSLINITIGVSAILLFAMAVVEQNHQLMIASTTEPRTGLPNSYGYFRWIDKMRKKIHLSDYNAYYFELKEFNYYNRKYGSDIMVKLQKKYHESIFNVLQGDEIVGNLGGDYYVALVRKIHTDRFLKVLAGIDVVIEHNGVEIHEKLSCITGGYSIETDDTLSEDLIANTAIAVSMARHQGNKEVVFINDEIKERIFESREMERIIPLAMQNKEFVPYYQPKVSVTDKKIYGAEALVRWERNGGIVPPGKFIPLLEENDRICEMDFYMLRYVCSDIAGWLAEGLTVPVISVNFSRKNLANKTLVMDITHILDEYNVPHNLIQVEITETVDEHPLEDMNKLVNEFHLQDITVAIDDFGTGSSSMNLLRAVDFDVLKIDKSFVNCENERDRKILARIIKIAKDIGIGIVAEGVETKEQLMKLSESGCDNIQGYLFDKPLPKDEFEKRLIHIPYKF